MKTAKKSQARRARRKIHTEEYRKGNVTWKLRHIIPGEGDKHKNPFWIADNCDSRNRKRITGATKGEAIDNLNAYQDEIEKHGTAHSLDDDAREAVLRAKRITGGRATLDEIVRFWAERHPMDGNKITLADAVDQFMAEREALKNRPATIREIRQKLTAFKNAIGPETAIAGIWADDITRFMAGTGGGDVSRRAWKKVLVSFSAGAWTGGQSTATPPNPSSFRKRRKSPRRHGRRGTLNPSCGLWRWKRQSMRRHSRFCGLPDCARLN